MWRSLVYSFVLTIVLTINALTFVRKEFRKPQLQVQTGNGIVQGIKYKSTVQGSFFAFFGIPYAQPPIGQLRFQEPREARNWSGILDGSKQRSFCVELLATTEKLLAVSGSEDCLYLNIYTSRNPFNHQLLLPVLVFIHGGLYQEGNSDIGVYGPDFLVKKDILVVIFNYRLGLFGFLSTEDLASPGNYGLKDQNLALRWIQKNIQNFGGDPNSVTIFGQSAGAASVHFHILSPKSKGLFHRAIMDAGSVLCSWSNQRKPRNVAYFIGIANGITNPKDSFDLINRLRKINVDALMESQVLAYLITLLASPILGFPFAPAVEPIHKGAFITTDSWYNMLKFGKFNRVPVIIGNAANESLYFSRIVNAMKPLLVAFEIDPTFYSPAALLSELPYERLLEIGKMVRRFYFGDNGGISISDLGKAFRYSNSNLFTRPIRKTALLMAKYIPVYYYQFSYIGRTGFNGLSDLAKFEKRRGVRHTEILYYLFNKSNNHPNQKNDTIVRERLVKLWTNFVKYSDPIPKNEALLQNISWPKISTMDEHMMQYLDINNTLDVRRYFSEKSEIDFWNSIFSKYLKFSLRNY